MVGIFIYTYTVNSVPAGTGWFKKVNKYNNVLTTMSVKLDVD